MRIGIGLWCLQSTATAPRPFPRAYAELVEDARLAERVGLDSLWLSEHHVFYDGYCSALLPAASGVLSATSQLRVGTGILLLPLQRPERVAAAAAELHRVSAGRFELGLGMGYRPIEFAAKEPAHGRSSSPHGAWPRRGGRERVPRRATALGRGDERGGGAPSRPPRARSVPLGRFFQGGGRRADRRAPRGVVRVRRAGGQASAHWPAAEPLGGRRRGRAAARGGMGAEQLPWCTPGWDGEPRTRVSISLVRSRRRSTRWSLRHSSEMSTKSSTDWLDTRASSWFVCRIGYDAPPRPALTDVIERIGSEVAPKLVEVGR